MRIGINVPDKVIKLIKKLDPEANISQICREALTSYTTALERARTEITDEDMDDIIEHLEQSAPYPQSEPDWADYAWQDAQDWIRTITPHDWHYFLYSYDHHKDNSRELYICAQFYRLPSRGEVKNFTDRFIENEGWFWHQAVIDGNSARQKAHEKAENDYIRTWLAYVNEVRRKCLQYRAEKNDEVLADRQKAWLSRPEPELPFQLLDGLGTQRK